jgi:hypothetical protein
MKAMKAIPIDHVVLPGLGLEVVDASLQQHARAELISASVAASCSSGAYSASVAAT